ncbi:MerR family transcriptional regulator [Devosia sp. Root436]|uniref:MerR family transcriptional regulator n=1 Tax=Devosia sp. Root436 TaxID=1736537 RepID=UPI0006F2F245|nr:helix-turn-helix domain-containing protein [Devosia sp. Root436]KQX38302.1 MerR family transcriptional regulator [Devosia sp. Root436]
MGVFIGKAAERSGVKVPTIRYYEEIGLLRPTDRSGSNRRLFDADDLNRLGFIRHARELGFQIGSIRQLLDLQDQPGQSCASIDAIATERLGEVRARIGALRALEAELERMLESCSHGVVGDCRVIDALSPGQKGEG